MKPLPAILVIVLVMLSGCASSSPAQIVTFYVSGQVKQYFIPGTIWRSKNKDLTVKLDITYRNEGKAPTICNISVYHKGRTPESVSTISLVGGNIRCPLSDISTLLTRPEHHELRITSTAPIDSLTSLLGMKPLWLEARLDSASYQFNPPKEFYAYGKQFIELNR